MTTLARRHGQNLGAEKVKVNLDRLMFLVKRDFGLFPADEKAKAAVAKIPQGQVVTADVEQPRNLKHHRLFFVLVDVCWDNSDHEIYPTSEIMRAAIQLSAGHYDLVQLPSGEFHKVPKSLRFSRMNQIEFSAFYENACDVVARDYLHILPATVKEEVERMIGIIR